MCHIPHKRALCPLFMGPLSEKKKLQNYVIYYNNKMIHGFNKIIELDIYF